MAWLHFYLELAWAVGVVCRERFLMGIVVPPALHLIEQCAMFFVEQYINQKKPWFQA